MRLPIFLLATNAAVAWICWYATALPTSQPKQQNVLDRWFTASYAMWVLAFFAAYVLVAMWSALVDNIVGNTPGASMTRMFPWEFRAIAGALLAGAVVFTGACALAGLSVVPVKYALSSEVPASAVPAKTVPINLASSQSMTFVKSMLLTSCVLGVVGAAITQSARRGYKSST